MTMAVRARMAGRRARTVSDATVPPIWRESFWPVDWLALRMSPVYYGVGVPRGDGGPVIVVPGFLCTDAYMYEMYAWLGRIGYRPYLSGIGLNADCPAESAGRLIRTAERARRETGRRVRLVGHSLGGMIGRRVALRHPELISQLLYMGTPIQGLHAHPAVLAAAAVLVGARSAAGVSHDGCFATGRECDLTVDAEMALPPSVYHAAIFTRADGVVDWHDALETEAARNHEVGGTHVGLVYNPRAYRVLGDLLSQRSA